MEKKHSSLHRGNAASCDWLNGDRHKKKDNRSHVYRCDNYTWRGVKAESYKQETGDWAAVVRQNLIGSKGETPHFHLRYFEIAPGGFSDLEMHDHEHVVVCVRGMGTVRIEKKQHTIRHLDTVYIAPGSQHQLANPYDEPFGFLCIVNAERDRPVPVSAKRERPPASAQKNGQK